MIKNSLVKALWWDKGDQKADSGNSYNYVRLCLHDSKYNLLISGGGDYHIGGEFGLSGVVRYDLPENWTR
ncbi:MAG: hypothetical protein SGJ15_10290 [Bacteroidota bacterium]|nr:hypothetical protein [Bacteroidota bacterium]